LRRKYHKKFLKQNNSMKCHKHMNPSLSSKVGPDMDDHVWLHAALLAEGFPTHVTLERFLPRVDPLVLLQLPRARLNLATESARETLGAALCKKMMDFDVNHDEKYELLISLLWHWDFVRVGLTWCSSENTVKSFKFVGRHFMVWR